MEIKVKNNKTTENMLSIIVSALNEKKGEDIKVIDISNISVIADYFIIASGSNINQIQRMADEAAERMHKEGYTLRQIEGYDTANWILMDFNDVIVHIFNKENRLFYDLERVWSDGINIDSSKFTIEP